MRVIITTAGLQTLTMNTVVSVIILILLVVLVAGVGMTARLVHKQSVARKKAAARKPPFVIPPRATLHRNTNTDFPSECKICPKRAGYYTCEHSVLDRADIQKGPLWTGANSWIANTGNKPMLRDYALPSVGESNSNYFLTYRGKRFWSSSVGPDPNYCGP